MKEYLEIFTRHVEKLAEIDHYGDDGYTREFQVQYFRLIMIMGCWKLLVGMLSISVDTSDTTICV